MNFKTYHKDLQRDMDCALYAKVNNRWIWGRKGPCLAPLRQRITTPRKWCSQYKGGKIQAVAVYTEMPIMGMPAFYSVIRYLENAPQYGGAFRYDRKRRWLVCDSTTINAEAMVHGFRNYLNMRERPAGAILFHALTSDGIDEDAAFLVAMSFYKMVHTKGRGYRFIVGSDTGHNGVKPIPNSPHARKENLEFWKNQKPSGKSYINRGYSAISRYSGEAKDRALDAGDGVRYKDIKKIALTYY